MSGNRENGSQVTLTNYMSGDIHNEDRHANPAYTEDKDEKMDGKTNNGNLGRIHLILFRTDCRM